MTLEAPSTINCDSHEPDAQLRGYDKLDVALSNELNRKGQIASVVLYSTLEGLIAAFVAMFLRDLVAIVETRRRRS
jgi:hypothetical protein